MARKLSSALIIFSFLFLTTGCARRGSLPSSATRIAVDHPLTQAPLDQSPQGAHGPEKYRSITKETTALHGTINVLLGNHNGLVAVTDSRLSDLSGLPYPKPAPKLFKLDYQTICTVAGFYADQGPELPDGERPASMAASDLISRYVTLTRGHDLSLAKRVEMLINIFQFSLNLVTRMDLVASTHQRLEDRLPRPQSLILTVAGYDNDRSIAVTQVYLTAHQVEAGYEYTPVPTQRQGICANSYRLTHNFECSLSGLTTVADSILRGTDRKSKKNPAVIKFLRAKRTGKLDALDTSDLLDLARYLKERSSENPQQNVIGGPTQSAILENDGVAFSDEPVKPVDWLKATNFNTYENGSLGSDRSYVGGNLPNRGGLLASPTMGAMVVNGHGAGIIQPLDNVIFINTVFDRCVLTYDGSPMSMFDVSNVVVDSELIISPRVDLNAGLIKQIRADFPNLQIQQRVLPFPQSWTIMQAGPPRPR
jgi:20S proteasome alpha/beta subunit